jgi:hypothetical protein
MVKAKADGEFKPKKVRHSVCGVGYRISITGVFVCVSCIAFAECPMPPCHGPLCHVMLRAARPSEGRSDDDDDGGFCRCVFLLIGSHTHLCFLRSYPFVNQSILMFAEGLRQEGRQQETAFGIHALFQGKPRQNQGRKPRYHLWWNRKEAR